MLLFLLFAVYQSQSKGAKSTNAKAQNRFKNSYRYGTPLHVKLNQAVTKTRLFLSKPTNQLSLYEFTNKPQAKSASSDETATLNEQTINKHLPKSLNKNSQKIFKAVSSDSILYELNSKNPSNSKFSSNLNANPINQKQNKNSDNQSWKNFYHHTPKFDFDESDNDNQPYQNYFKPTKTPSPYADSEDEDTFIPAWNRFKKPTITPFPENDEDEENQPFYFYPKPTKTPTIEEPTSKSNPFPPNLPVDEEKEEEDDDFIPAWERFNKPTKTPIWYKPTKPTPTPLVEPDESNNHDEFLPYWKRPTSTPIVEPDETNNHDDYLPYWKRPTPTSIPSGTIKPNPTASISPIQTQSPTPSETQIVITETPTATDVPTQTASQSPTKSPTSIITAPPTQSEVSKDDDQINVNIPKQAEQIKATPKKPSGLHSTDVIIMISMLGAALLVLIVGAFVFFTGGHNPLGNRDEESLMNTGFY